MYHEAVITDSAVKNDSAAVCHAGDTLSLLDCTSMTIVIASILLCLALLYYVLHTLHCLTAPHYVV